MKLTRTLEFYDSKSPMHFAELIPIFIPSDNTIRVRHKYNDFLTVADLLDTTFHWPEERTALGEESGDYLAYDEIKQKMENYLGKKLDYYEYLTLDILDKIGVPPLLYLGIEND